MSQTIHYYSGGVLRAPTNFPRYHTVLFINSVWRSRCLTNTLGSRAIWYLTNYKFHHIFCLKTQLVYDMLFNFLTCTINVFMVFFIKCHLNTEKWRYICRIGSSIPKSDTSRKCLLIFFKKRVWLWLFYRYIINLKRIG